jgi:hypothetical protein
MSRRLVETLAAGRTPTEALLRGTPTPAEGALRDG